MLSETEGRPMSAPLLFIDVRPNYSVCHKFFPLGGSQIPLNPPFSKGDFTSNSLYFPPFFKGGQGGL